jgi:DNA polymerase I-like protein with 3'-5' exonuclease and polymerase domains
VFLFRIIFGGTAYSFAQDNDFAECKFNTEQWEAVIYRFYRKYRGIHTWHEAIVRQATTTGILTIPTGRSWSFEASRDYKGELKWPITKIKNYPVQGLESDLMSITRVSLWNRLKHDKEILFINSVHDSILLDVPRSKVDSTVAIIAKVFDDVPANFKRLFGATFNLPYRGEIEIGMDWLNMEKVEVKCG